MKKLNVGAVGAIGFATVSLFGLGAAAAFTAGMLLTGFCACRVIGEQRAEQREKTET